MRRSMAMIASASLLLVGSCRVADAPKEKGSTASYFDNSKHPDAWSGGARKITISTPKGPHQVWIKRVGNNPKLKLLLLTGGPGFSHSYLEVMDSYLPAEGVEYYHYDQLETGESDRPDDPDLWTSRAMSTRSTRSAARSAGRRTISACLATAGAGCWRWNMRWPTRTR